MLCHAKNMQLEVRRPCSSVASTQSPGRIRGPLLDRSSQLWGLGLMKLFWAWIDQHQCELKLKERCTLLSEGRKSMHLKSAVAVPLAIRVAVTA